MLRVSVVAAARRIPRLVTASAGRRGLPLLRQQQPPVRLLHSSERATARLPSPNGLARGAAAAPGGWRLPKALPAWIPCSGSVSMVLRTAGRGFRSTAARAAEARQAASGSGAAVVAATAAYCLLNGRFFATFSPKTGAFLKDFG